MADTVKLVEIDHFKEKMIELLIKANNLPTLDREADFLIANDVVPVVRCKDCKHLGFKGLCDGVCNRKMIGIVTPDDFCSYGERKDND